jgi:3-hydroxybutyryl-CoA dehydrogenase
MISCLGAGRMARGIAVVFCYAGYDVTVVDCKARSPESFARLVRDLQAEIAATVAMLARIGLMRADQVAPVAARVRVVAEPEARFDEAELVFEGVPEILDIKRDVLARVSRLAGSGTIIASTTSTILVDALADSVVNPERFLNAHWLNPAFLIPLVEVSPAKATAKETTARLIALLEGIGKVPVICAARPGFIVPRIQALAMNEAARMVEEGVASAADIDRAVKYGFGFRFAVLGLLEFIDWGGSDILHYASAYLAQALDNHRYEAPDIIRRNMTEGKSFLDYQGVDMQAYREGRLSAFVDLLRAMGLARPPIT